MTSAHSLVKKMFEFLEAQKRDINQLYIVSQKAITDLYRTNSYAAQLEGILKKIDALLGIHERLKRTVPEMTDKERKQYAQLLNNISVELRLLKSTSEAMDDTLKKMRKSGELEHTFTGNIIGLKKEVSKTLKKVEEILNNS